MTKQTENFIQRLRALELSDNKKLAMRERLVSYMDLHPVQEPATGAGRLSAFFSLVSSQRFPAYAASLLVLIIAGGSITLASEGTAPGDTLYPVKVSVSEPLMTLLATTDTDQARVAAELATRRADEAVQLASKGKLTPERKEYLAARITASVNKADEKADQAALNGNPEGAETIRANLAAGLAGEAQALGAAATTQVDGDRTNSEGILALVIASGDQITGSAAASVALDTEDDKPTFSKKPSHGFSLAVSGSLSKTASTSTSTPDNGNASTTAKTAAKRGLHISATTTLNTLRTEKSFGEISIPSPSVDSALPSLPSAAVPAVTSGINKLLH